MLKKITDFNDYREYIKDQVAQKNKSYRELCLNCNIHTSYFSRVMTGKANFSPEQLFLIAEELQLNSWQKQYFLYLGQLEQSGHHQYKTYVKEQLLALQEKHNKIITEMKEIKDLSPEQRGHYYLDSLTAKIHMFLTIKKYRDRPSLISNTLKISNIRLNKELEKLEKLSIIEMVKGHIILKKNSVHLPDNDPAVPYNHINWRLEAIEKIKMKSPSPSDYHLSAVFSTNPDSKLKIKNLFKKFIIEAQNEAVKIKSDDEVYAISFDLYDVSMEQ